MDLWNEGNDSFLDSANINFETPFTLDETVDLVDIDSDDFKLCTDNGLFSEDFSLQDSLNNEHSDSSDSGIGSARVCDGKWIPFNEKEDNGQFHRLKPESDNKLVLQPQNHVRVDLTPETLDPLRYATGVIPQQKCLNISSIMDSKVKIKPKPIENCRSLSTVTIQNNQALNEDSIQSGTMGMLINPMHNHLQIDLESRTTKRQQRMIKNRESACLSRKRKKEYMNLLEKQLQECTVQNEKLKEENYMLKEKIRAFENEQESLKRTLALSPTKKICLMGVFFILCMNMFSGKLSLVQDWQPARDLEKVQRHKGRQLLSYPERGEIDLKRILSNSNPQKFQEFLNSYDVFTGNKSENKCATYLNHTESMKLAEQLSGWMQRFKLEKQKTSTKKLRKLKKFPRSSYFQSINGQIQKLSSKILDSQYQLQLFNYNHKQEDFWQIVSKRNDTFYILSFNTDYYLVPAALHNRTERPRMSLFMPALSLNDSVGPPFGKVGMIQIDCEVKKTEFINVQKSMLPNPSLQQNVTFFSGYGGI